MPTSARNGLTIMEAGGMYSQHNPNSFSTIDRVVPVVCKAATSTESLKDESAFTYFDLGTADGGVGSVVAKALVNHIKSINRDKPIHIVFEDQAENDFSPILTKHQNTISDSFDDVFVSFVGRSFYKQCLPAESVHVSFSAVAAHWSDLDNDAEHEPPPPFAPIGSSLKWTSETKNNDDWQRFLLHRARELKKNGQLVVAHMLLPTHLTGSSPSDKAYATLTQTYFHFFDVYDELRKEGRLHPDESFANPVKFRTEEELEAPFLNKSSAVQQAGLSLRSIEKITIPCPNTKLFREGKLSKEEYGRALAFCLRSWSYSLVLNSLNGERSKEEKDSLVEEFFTRLTKCITANVPNVGLPYPMAIVVAKKE